MKKYAYQAIDESGKTVSSVVEAESVEMANSILLTRGLIPTSVTTESGTSPRQLWLSLRGKNSFCQGAGADFIYQAIQDHAARRGFNYQTVADSGASD